MGGYFLGAPRRLFLRGFLGPGWTAGGAEEKGSRTHG